MPGRKRISANQVRRYMESRQEGKTQIVSAARADISERSARRIERRNFQIARVERKWKTRKDPFEPVWEKDLVPLLENEPKLEAKTLLEILQNKYESRYPDRLLRTLQRRVKKWKVLFGPEKEIIFRQEHIPGWQGISDFTNANELNVTIRGEPLHHLLYHYRLSFSGWEYVQIVLGGESYSALAEGLQNAFWESGGVPETHRTDSLSAAYKNCSDKEKEAFTESYTAFCNHYGTNPTRNNKGISHENGSIESPNRHIKHRIDQVLLARASRDFDSVEQYKSFVVAIIERSNKRKEKEFAEEKAVLKPLPERKTADYTEERVRVTSSSTISLKGMVYTVPSRLVGTTLKVLMYDDRLECYSQGDHVISLPRLRSRKKRLHLVNYRHVAANLLRKPQAFRHYIYREDLFPNDSFRRAWYMLDANLGGREACREFVKILFETSQSEEEKIVSDYLEECMACGRLPSSMEVKKLFHTSIFVPSIEQSCSDPGEYNALFSSFRGGAQ